MNAKLIRSGLAVLSAALAAAFVASPVGLADEEEDQTFRFEVDPFTFETLFTEVDTRSSKFEEYRDMESDALVRRLRVLGESGDGNRTLEFGVWNAGRADARYTLQYGSAGRYALTLDYNVIPHRFGNDATLIHSIRDGGRYFAISDTTQQTLQSAVEAQAGGGGPLGFDFLRSQLQPFIDTATLVDTRLERRRTRATIDIGKLSRLAWKIDIQQETREGSRPYGATFGFSNAIELLEPVQYDTRSVELSGEWKADRGGLRFGLNLSRFDNKADTLLYDNPWRVSDSTDSFAYASPGTRSIGGPSLGLNVLSPDNRAGQLFVSGHARFGGEWWLNGQLSLGRMEQDEEFVAHTVNSAINPSVVDPSIRPPFDASSLSSLPEREADTEVDVLHFTLNAGTKFAERFSAKFRARYYDYDNKSPRLEFPGYVRMDAVWEEIPRITVPYAYQNQKIGAAIGFDPTPKTHIAVGYDRLSWDRDFREIDESDEDIYHLTFDSRQIRNVVLSAGWEHGKRTTDRYELEAQLDSFLDPDRETDNLPGLRKYDEAERTFNQGRVSASIMATDAIHVTVGASLRDDDYDESEFGLISDKILNYNAEIGFTPNDRISAFVYAQRTDRETFQRGRQSGGTPSTNPQDNWDLELEEYTNTFGLGFTGRIGSRWTASVNVSWSDSDGDSDFFSPPGGSPDRAVSFDEYDDNEWIVYSGRLDFHVNDNVTAGLMLLHEEFETNRFQREGLRPYLPGSLILDLNDGDYDADLLVVDLTIRF